MKQVLLLAVLILFSISIYSQIPGPPVPAGYTPLYFCDDENYDGIINLNLTELEPNVVFGESVLDYSFTYTYSLAFDTVILPLENPSNFTNSSNGQVVYIKATHNITGDWKLSTYVINVIHQFNVNKPSDLIVCDANNSGINTFVLSTKNEEILAGLNPYIYEVNYFLTYNDAINSLNPLDKNSYDNISNPQIVYARANPQNGSNCFDIVPLELNVQDSCSDIAVYLISTSELRPGFQYRNELVVKNLSSNIQSGQVEFKYYSLLEFFGLTEVNFGNSYSETSTGFVLNFNNLAPNQEEKVKIHMKAPMIELGTMITNEATYNGTDVNSNNNISTIKEIVIGSYDPNDILESHGPEILHSSFDSDDYLYYTVRFQNVGTADAINVKIDNTLDSRLDKSTIQMLNSSHSNVFTRVDDQLNWQFDNIHLPSESMDEPNSHGYVYYKIKPLVGYSVGDIIPNRAEIYFDFNAPVITNTFETEFTTTLSNTKFKDSEFSIFPNPANYFVKLKFNRNTNNIVKTSIYDIQGKLVFNEAKTVENATMKLDVSQFIKGMYFLKVNDGSSEITKKLIVK